MDRRQLLRLGVGAAIVSALPACSDNDGTGGGEEATMGDVESLTYGRDPSQKADLFRPKGRSKGVVVVIHGGFWKAQYDYSLGRPLATSLAREGWTALNLEYRRVGGTGQGGGGGFPETFDDIAAGIDLLAGVDGLDTSRTIALGHSAGGQLAVWAAGRAKLDDPRWSSPEVPLTAAVSQAGVLDLRGGVQQGLGGGAVEAFLGPDEGDRYDLADPLSRIPLDVPVWCVHDRDDRNVPIVQSKAYVSAAKAAGATAGLITVDGNHFTLIDPTSEAWARTLTLLDTL